MIVTKHDGITIAQLSTKDDFTPDPASRRTGLAANFSLKRLDQLEAICELPATTYYAYAKVILHLNRTSLMVETGRP
jgi:hypothetical protein